VSAATLADALQGAWSTWPERPALVHRGRTTTYRGLGEAAAALAGTYATLGIGRGDRIACSVSNRPEHVAALAAAWLHGAVHVCVDHDSTAPELSRIVASTQATALVWEPAAGSAEPLATLRTLRDEHPGIAVLVVGEEPVPDGCLPVSTVLATAGHRPEAGAGPAPDDPALIFISSGTTGTPKATVGFHGNLAGRWPRLAGWLGFGPDDVHLAQLPLSHGFGLLTAISALLSGGTLALLGRSSTGAVLRTIGEEGVTVVNGAPAHFRLILDRLDPALHDVGSLRLSIGTAATFQPSLIRAIRRRLGVDFVVMYGSSEGIGVATKDLDDILLGAVGRPAPGSVAIVASDHARLPAGEVGEIAFSRSVYPVRYWQPADALREDDGWYYSGDLGRLDADGRLYVYGRLKHQIDRGGLKVDPAEVEAAVLRCAGVTDAAVIALPNPMLGESVCACVVPGAAGPPSLEQLRASLAAELAPYKLPEELCLVESIPRTALGKVALDVLRGEVMDSVRQSVRIAVR
jgi:acyl-CoA synthetase (AMP-forming)/AMP-acid ligase II